MAGLDGIKNKMDPGPAIGLKDLTICRRQS